MTIKYKLRILSPIDIPIILLDLKFRIYFINDLLHLTLDIYIKFFETKKSIIISKWVLNKPSQHN